MNYEFINHGVNHISDIGNFSNQREGYEYCQHGAGSTLKDAIESALYHVDELWSTFFEQFDVKDTGEIENQADCFWFVTFFYNR